MEENKEVYVSIRKESWKDLEDNDYIYKEGDIYPRKGLEVSKKRLKELSSTKNKIGEILIKKVEVTANKSNEDDNKDDLEISKEDETEITDNDPEDSGEEKSFEAEENENNTEENKTE